MTEWLVPMATSVLLTLLEGFIKNPEKKAEHKRRMLKIYTVIKQMYAGDEDFQ
jgi:hypothetical protein